MGNSRLSVVVGGQFGSEAKGAVTGYLGSELRAENTGKRVFGVRVAGPNAGHTVYGGCPSGCSPLAGGHLSTGTIMQHPWKLRQVPAVAVTNINARLFIAAGSEIDPLVLADEIRQLDAAGYQASERVIVDPQATVLLPVHREQESSVGLVGRIGSTGKGVGAARADRVMRTALTFGEWRVREMNRIDSPTNAAWGEAEGIERAEWDAAVEVLRRVGSTNTSRVLNGMLRFGGNHVLVEGTQGFGLGLHTGFYPQTTSSDARAVDFLAMAGISPWLLRDQGDLAIWVVMRTHPIRVAGNSGPLAGETSWEDLQLPTERTTVTNKVRRVGSWDPLLARDAVEANGAPSGNVHIALTMADHAIPAVAGRTTMEELNDDSLDTAGRLSALLDGIQQDCLGIRPTLVGTGPTTIIDLRDGKGAEDDQ